MGRNTTRTLITIYHGQSPNEFIISRAKALVPPTPQLGWGGCPGRELLHHVMLILYSCDILWLYRLLLYMYTCIGGIMCTRHTDYIHNYMTIRDMLRHIGWLGFWMNCALMSLKRKRCQTHRTWVCPTLLCVDACVLEATRAQFTTCAGKYFTVRKMSVASCLDLERPAEGFEAFEGGQTAGSDAV